MKPFYGITSNHLVMTVDSPNADRIDDFEARIMEHFVHERMEEWPLERLNEARWYVENEFKMFKATFPPQESVVQGEMRAFLLDNPNDHRQALTDEERMRLRHIKRTALGEIYRAEGRRKDYLRQHRLKVYNTAVDFIGAVGRSFRSLLS
jgi:hypothetical protein